MAQWKFEDGAIFYRHQSADPQVIGDAIEQITAQAGGRLKPQHVVEAARKRSHPLHQHFEWSDKIAAEAHRLDQARQIIRSVTIVRDTDINGASARAYHSINDDGVSYRSTTEVQTSTFLQLQLHKQALRDLNAFEYRYQSIAAVCSLVQVARRRLENTIAELEEKPVVVEAPKPRRGRPPRATLESRP